MGIILIFVSSVLSVTQSVLTKFSSTGGRTPRTLSFNLFKTFSAFILFALICVWNFNWHGPTVLYACLYGIFLLSSNIFGFLALTKGPMALTSLICTYNIVIPCIYGIAFLDEKVSLLRGVGFVLLAISLLFLKKKDVTVEFKKHWALFTGITFLGNGVFSIIIKMHQTMYPGKYRAEFMCISMLVGFLVLLFVTLFSRQKPNSSEMSFSIPAGLLMSGTNFLSLYLSATVDATVLFPLTTVFSICINCVMSKIIFKDKFTLMQIVGIVMGVISIILIK